MSHHFDTAAAREDGRVDLADLYVFESSIAGRTVLIMTVNPDAGKSSPTMFRPDAFYDFRIDNNDDLHEDVTFRFRFNGPDGMGQQSYSVECIVNSAANPEVLGRASTNVASTLPDGTQVWAGVAADPFFADGVALGEFQQALFTQQRFFPEAFQRGFNLFGGRNVTLIVLEIASERLGSGKIHMWAVTAITEGDRSAQVERIGKPLTQPIFNVADGHAHAHNQAQPADDLAQRREHVTNLVATVTGLRKTANHPTAYGSQVAEWLLPDVLTYEINTPAAYTFASRNGRNLADDVMDVTLTILLNQPTSDNVSSDNRFKASFPYVAEAHVQSSDMPSIKAMLLGQ